MSDDWNNDDELDNTDFGDEESHVDEDFLYEQMVDREMDLMHEELAAIAACARSDEEVRSGLNQAVVRLLAGCYYKDDARKLYEHIYCEAFSKLERKGNDCIVWQAIADEAMQHEFLNPTIHARDFK